MAPGAALPKGKQRRVERSNDSQDIDLTSDDVVEIDVNGDDDLSRDDLSRAIAASLEDVPRPLALGEEDPDADLRLQQEILDRINARRESEENGSGGDTETE